MKVVVVSGYFDPIHIGHLELMERARSLGTKLIVIINNDKQLFMKRGKGPFMNQDQRKRLIEALKFVDEVFISIDEDPGPDNKIPIIESLREINRREKVHIFANGGDRHQGEIPESSICRELGIEMVDGLGEKVASSRDYYNQN